MAAGRTASIARLHASALLGLAPLGSFSTRTREIVIEAPRRIDIVERELGDDLAPHEVLVSAECSIVSAGTEGATYTGEVLDMPPAGKRRYPRATGYGHMGTVVAAGRAISSCRPGDRVLSFSPHASMVKADSRRLVFRLPADADPEDLVFARMAGVSIAAHRVATARPGDKAVVVGMGLVGNLAAQMLRLHDVEVLVVDPSAERLRRARRCGLEAAIDPTGRDLIADVRDWTGGRLAHTVVEATGRADVAATAMQLAGAHGEVVLLGTPRAPARLDLMPPLLHVHENAVRVVGALEARWVADQATGAADPTAYEDVVRWIVDGRLQVTPLLTHLVRPEDCRAVYEGLTTDTEAYLGVVFDWRD